MGKASKWMIKFLLGKKEEKEKKKYISLSSEETTSNPAPFFPATPIARHRWSFRRSESKERANKSSKYSDSILASPVVKNVSSELENQKNNKKTGKLSTAEATKTLMEITAFGVNSRTIQDSAATKIQAAFRSYLARKALWALKGLVKLQALVRGHLVRKQTTATLRRMHALMAIQVRARFERIQMAEESQLVAKSLSLRHGEFPLYNKINTANRQDTDVDLYEEPEVLKGKNSNLNHSEIRKRDHGISQSFYGEASFQIQEDHLEEDLCLGKARNSPHQGYQNMSKPIPARASFTYQQPDYPINPLSNTTDLQFRPHYMANTTSSRAKVRSQSEPKQRARWNMKQKNKQVSPMDGLRNNVSVDGTDHTHQFSLSSSLKHFGYGYGSHDPWLKELYQATRSFNDTELNAGRTTDSSSFSKQLLAYEQAYNFQ